MPRNEVTVWKSGILVINLGRKDTPTSSMVGQNRVLHAYPAKGSCLFAYLTVCAHFGGGKPFQLYHGAELPILHPLTAPRQTRGLLPDLNAVVPSLVKAIFTIRSGRTIGAGEDVQEPSWAYQVSRLSVPFFIRPQLSLHTVPFDEARAALTTK